MVCVTTGFGGATDVFATTALFAGVVTGAATTPADAAVMTGTFGRPVVATGVGVIGVRFGTMVVATRGALGSPTICR